MRRPDDTPKFRVYTQYVFDQRTNDYKVVGTVRAENAQQALTFAKQGWPIIGRSLMVGPAESKTK